MVIQGWRPQAGVPGVWHPQILADQLTLSQPGGSDYCPPHYLLLLAPPDYQTFLRPCHMYERSTTST